MCRFLIGVGAVILLFALICTAFGSDAFMWVLIISFVGAGLALALMPRKGPQHTYENWYRLQALIILLVICGLFAGFMWLVLHSAPTADAAGMAIGGFTVALSGAAYAYGHLIGPPTRRRGWLRRHYPAVARAIKRYQRAGDRLEDYTPALAIGGRRYFLVFYHDKRDPRKVAGIVLLDEEGRRVRDEGLLRQAAACKTLALSTIDYAEHQARARALMDADTGARGLRQVFGLFRRERAWFARAGTEAMADYDRVMAAEEASQLALEISHQVTMIQAEWAAKHRLGRLTEVDYEDAAKLEADMAAARMPMWERMPDFTQAIEPARRLAEMVKGTPTFPQARLVQEGLLGVADSAELLSREGRREYGSLAERHWQAWRDRMAWADEVDARLAEKAKQQTVK